MPTSPRSRSRLPLLLGGSVVMAVLVALLVWFLSGDEPSAVDLGASADAGAQATDTTETADIEVRTESSGDGSFDDLSGTWEVDVQAEPFDRADGSGTFVGYRIDEELSGIGATTAVGRTPDVDGSVTIEGTTVVAAEVTGDLTGLSSDDGRRDGRVRSTFSPGASATFVLGAPIDVGDVPVAGEVRQAAATGRLTVDGVTREVEVMLQATVVDGRLVVAGSTVISLADFDVTAPSAPVVLSVADEATVEWQLYLTRPEPAPEDPS